MEQEIKRLLHQSDLQIQSILENKDLQFFKTYLSTNTYIRNENYDCSEIADDFYEHLQGGNINVIEPVKVGFHTFNVLEWGKLKQVVNHYVYTKNGVVFDPRFYGNPIFYPIYISLLQLLNPDQPLKIEEE